MKTPSKKYTTIDEYIEIFPKETQEKLQKMRKVIHEAAPEAIEAISYGIPTFKLNGNLVHFGGFKDHISFFPSSSPFATFEEELKPYAKSKGTIQFPNDKPIPFDLVTRITKFRVKENGERGKNKKTKY